MDFRSWIYLIHCSTISALLTFSCSSPSQEEDALVVEEPVPIDLKEIVKKEKLTILAENSSTSFFIYKGQSMGFEYELLREFANDIGVELEVKIVDDLDNVTNLLNSGEGDIIACNFTKTKQREEAIDFSIPFIRTPQVLIQRRPRNWKRMTPEQYSKHVLRDPADLIRKEIHVWKQSSYNQRLDHIQEEFGDTICVVQEPGTVSVEEMIEMVAEGIIDYTIAEEYIAKVNANFYPNLDYFMYLSIRQNIAFGLRKTSPLLKAKLNAWLRNFMSKKTFSHLKNKYFEPANYVRNNSNYLNDIKGGRLSAFDDLFKKVANEYQFDWIILASIACQESSFDPNAAGFGGAYGLMQFMPNTGPQYGVYPGSTPEIQIRGGMKKIYNDFNCFKKAVNDEQRLKFAIGAYNAGLGHIIDAQRLCIKHKMNPYIWDKNVEYMLLQMHKSKYYRDPVVRSGAMRGKRTFRYVREVFSRYKQWKLIYK